MKKVITLILLLAVGGTIFILGWAQFKVPAGSVGVIRSKTHGINTEIVREGEFSWYWYKLIPNNVTIAVFTLKEIFVPFDFSGVLPSGETYSALAGLKTDFSYSLSGSFYMRLKAESLPALSEKENLLTQADLDSYCSRLTVEIKNHTQTALWSYGENETIVAEIRESGTIKALEQDLAQAFPGVEILNCTVKPLKYPDFVLYNEIRQLYRDYLGAQRSDVQTAIARMGAENVQNRRRIEELSGYGELLTKYPILLEYLALEKN